MVCGDDVMKSSMASVTGMNGTCSSPGTPSSPGRRRGKKAGKGMRMVLRERFMYMLIAAVFRRKGILLFAPLLYISGMLMYMGTLNLEVVPEGVGVTIFRRKPVAVGSVYRSPKVFEKLWPYMQIDGGNTSLAV